MAEPDTDEWRELFPAFAGAPDARIAHWFALACLLVDNTDASPILCERRRSVLYLIMCHLATLEQRGDAVGRVTSATQGSVGGGVRPV